MGYKQLGGTDIRERKFQVIFYGYLRLVFASWILSIVYINGVYGQEKKVDPFLAAYWSFDEGEGNIAKDLSGNGNDGAIHGATRVKGKVGNALRFNGKDDYVDCGNGAGLNAGTAITVECWVKTGSSEEHWVETDKDEAAAQQGGIVAKDDETGGRGWLLRMTGGGEAEFRIGRGKEWWSQGVASNAINNGVWHHIIGIDDGETLYLYIDGKSYSASIGTHPIFTHSLPLSIGKWNSGPFHFKGVIDEVKIYNRALDKKEVEKRYENDLKEK